MRRRPRQSGEPPESERPPEDESLSGTLFSGLKGLASTPYTLFRSGLGELSTVLTLAGVAGLALGVILLIFVPGMRLYSYIIMGIGGALLIVSLVLNVEAVGKAAVGRRARYSTNTTVMVVAFIGIASLANFLAFENSARMDVTATKQFSLAPRTVSLLKSLKEPIEAKAFLKSLGRGSSPEEIAALEAYRSQVDDLLHEFDVRSGKFSYEFIDPDVDPETAREYGYNRNGTVVFENAESQERHQVLPSLALEQEFVTGLLIVSGQERRLVYFLTGHGERRIDDITRDSDGFGFAHASILSESYATSPINLLVKCDPRGVLCDEPKTGQERLKQDRLEGKANMLVVAGPRRDLVEGEAEVLDEYLKNGGNMLFLAEPDTPQRFRDLLARWGIMVGNGHIVDTQRNWNNLNQNIAIHRDQYFGRIPEPLDSFLQTSRVTNLQDETFFFGATSLEPAEGVAFFPPRSDDGEGEEQDEQVPTIFGTALVLTSNQSWLVEDPTQNEPPEVAPQGPLFPVVAVRALAPLGGELPSNPADVKVASIVAFGDSDFVTNRWFSASSNSDFFLNSINWLVGDIPLANIRPKPLAPRSLVLTRNESNFMRYSSWLLLPVLMALAGGFVWWKRR